MAITWARLLMLAAAAGLVIAGLAVRGSPAGTGPVGQNEGLYAPMGYVGVLVLWPCRSPWAAD